VAVWVGIGLVLATTALGISQDEPQMIWKGEVDGVSILRIRGALPSVCKPCRRGLIVAAAPRWSLVEDRPTLRCGRLGASWAPNFGNTGRWLLDVRLAPARSGPTSWRLPGT
jgi:hypothetical protein